jgi:hypothetical protein
MAASAFLSPVTSVLSIDFTTSGAYNIDNPGLAFRVVSIQVYNGAGTPNVQVTNSSNDIAPTQAVSTNGWAILELDEAYCNIGSNTNIRVITANASTTKMLIFCAEYDGGYPLAVT